MRYLTAILLILVLFTTTPIDAATYSASLAAASSEYFSVTMNTPTGNMTACGWEKFASLPTSGNSMTIIAKHDGGNTSTGRSFDFSIDNVSGTQEMFWRSSTNGTSGGQTTGGLAVSITTGQWYYLCAVYQTTGTVTFYTSTGGTLTALGSITAQSSSIFNGTIPLSIGARSDPGAFVDGKEAQVVLYNTNLSTATMQANQCSTSPSATSLLGYWQLDNALTDLSGNGNTLTNHAATFAADLPSCFSKAASPGQFWDF